MYTYPGLEMYVKLWDRQDFCETWCTFISFWNWTLHLLLLHFHSWICIFRRFISVMTHWTFGPVYFGSRHAELSDTLRCGAMAFNADCLLYDTWWQFDTEGRFSYISGTVWLQNPDMLDKWRSVQYSHIQITYIFIRWIILAKLLSSRSLPHDSYITIFRPLTF